MRRSTFRIAQAFSLTVLLLTLTACSQTPRLIGDPEFPYPVLEPKVGDLIHVPTGHKLDFSQMIEAIAAARIIYVGETHDNPASHQFQLDVLRALQEKNPDGMALAMEMFTPKQQEILDRWSAGELEEEQFLRQVDWFSNWQMNFSLYRSLLSFCRDHQIPIIALNAPKSLVRKVGRTPTEKLDEEVRSSLPEMDYSDIYQRAMTESIYSGHTMGKAMSDGFIRVQTLWDESMAQNLVNFLQSPEGKDRQVVVVAGGNHVRYGFGIPRRVHRRVPVAYQLIGSREIEIAEGRNVQRMDVTMPKFPMRAWDYLKLTRYEKIATGVKLGTAIEENPRGILVKMVMPASAAEKAGLQKGDILLKADDVALEKRFDLLYLLMNLKEGAKISLEIERNGEQQNLRVGF